MVRRRSYPSKEYMTNNFSYSDGRLYRSNGKIAGYLHHHTKKDAKRFEVKIEGKNYLNSILIWIYHHGEIDDKHVVDHINSIEYDDRIENLQCITLQENNIKRIRNKRPNGYRGVYSYGNKYVAKIGKNNKQIHLGYFDNPEDAALAYDNAARDLFNNFTDFNLK